MATDLDKQLTSYFQWIEEDLGLPMRRTAADMNATVRSAHDVVRSDVVREGPRKGPSRWYAVAAAASLVVVLVTAGIIAATRPETTNVVPSDTQPSESASPTVSVEASAQTTIAPSTSNATSTSGQLPGTASGGVQGGSELIPASPLAGRIDPIAVWTGDRMIIWGGASPVANGQVPFADGAAYDPVLRVWTPLPPAPISARSNAATVWTGSEMLVWGGSDSGKSLGNSLFDGAAYNPTTNTWRQLPTYNLAATVRPTVAWTGAEMIVLEGANGSPRGAAFKPVTNSWRPIATPPGRGAVPYPHAVWTGTQMVVTLSKGPGDSAIIAAYDPQTDTWEELPNDLGSGQRPNLIWTGTEVLAFGMTDVPGRAWNPTTGTWRALAVAPRHRALSAQPIWTGQLAVFCNGGPTLAIYDATADTWSTSPTETLPAERVDGAALWTGRTLLTWGGFISNPDGTVSGANDGIAWTLRQD